MPAYLGQAHFHSLLQIQGVPVLEQISANDNLRNRGLNRFERDDPPPYASSTESEEIEDEFSIRQSNGLLPEDARVIMDSPLTGGEIRSLSDSLQMITRPAVAYRKEAVYEEARLRHHPSFLINPLFWRKNSERRTKVLVRHFIKRRWEKLGVWNPEWGIPVRNKQPNDNIFKWRWRWEQDDIGSPDSETAHSSHRGKLLVLRLLQLRQNLRRGETSPAVPQSHLAQDATAPEAESFIISRPWVTFWAELGEEETRRERALAADLLSLTQYTPGKQVAEWWKERGDWREKLDMPEGGTIVGSWKWRHESPSPEPEDLTPIDNMKDSLLDARDMDFTPSEIDALEAIPPPGYVSPVPPAGKIDIVFPDYLPKNLFGPLTPEEVPVEDHNDTSYEAEVQLSEQEQEVEEQLLEQQQDGSSAPSQNTRLQRQCQLRDEESNTVQVQVQVQDQDQDQPSSVRRSARIAGMKRLAESLHSEIAPNKKRKGKAIFEPATRATDPITRESRRRKSAQPAAAISGPNETQSRRERDRGRLRKNNRSGTAVTTEMRAPARRRGRGMLTDPPAVPRRRRRTGKNE